MSTLRNSSSEDFPMAQTYWKYGGNRTDIQVYLENPVCFRAEYIFLAFLIYLKNQNIDPGQLISALNIYSHDNKKHTRALTIRKKYFGIDTNLVLNGTLAGTVADRLPLRQMGEGNALAYRPLFDHGILKIVELEIGTHIKHLENNYLSEAYLKVLELCRELIVKHGYVHALILALSALDIPADFEHIEKNANTMNNIVIPTPEETKQISKTHA